MSGVDKAIVFGLRAVHSGLSVPSAYVAQYAAGQAGKMIGFRAIDPATDDIRSTLGEIVGLGLRGVKLGRSTKTSTLRPRGCSRSTSTARAFGCR